MHGKTTQAPLLQSEEQQLLLLVQVAPTTPQLPLAPLAQTPLVQTDEQQSELEEQAIPTALQALPGPNCVMQSFHEVQHCPFKHNFPPSTSNLPPGLAVPMPTLPVIFSPPLLVWVLVPTLIGAATLPLGAGLPGSVQASTAYAAIAETASTLRTKQIFLKRLFILLKMFFNYFLLFNYTVAQNTKPACYSQAGLNDGR